MMSKKVTALFLALFSASALAAGMSDKPDMSALDANGDGSISAEEAAASPDVAERFEALDQNQDQMLDEAEFSRFEVEKKGGAVEE